MSNAKKTSNGRRPAYRYVGNPGDYFHGIPPRDLTAEDLEQLTDEQKETVKQSAIYEEAGDA